jgi:hypothetical protein
MIKGVPTSTYREHRPPPALAGHVLCVWSQAIGAGESWHRHRVLPDGCADLVWIGDVPAVVAGPATGPVIVPLAPRTIVVGVRLRPGATPAVLGLPANELSNRDTPLRDIWGAGADALSARVIEQPSVAARLEEAAAALAGRLAKAGPLDPMIAASTSWLARAGSRSSRASWRWASGACAGASRSRSATARRPSSACCGCSSCWRSRAGLHART